MQTRKKLWEESTIVNSATRLGHKAIFATHSNSELTAATAPARERLKVRGNFVMQRFVTGILILVCELVYTFTDPQEMTIRERNKKLRKARAKVRHPSANTSNELHDRDRSENPVAWHFNSSVGDSLQSDGEKLHVEKSSASSRPSPWSARRTKIPFKDRHQKQNQRLHDLASAAGECEALKEEAIRASIATLWSAAAREEREANLALGKANLCVDLLVQELRISLHSKVQALSLDLTSDLGLHSSRLRKMAVPHRNGCERNISSNYEITTATTAAAASADNNVCSNNKKNTAEVLGPVSDLNLCQAQATLQN